MASAPPPRRYKVVLLGEGRVGKTSLAVRYCQNAFSEDQQATVQASFLTKRITVDGARVELAIWDTAGQERFHALGPIYYRDADAALLVYDITDVDSFERVKSWVTELKSMVGAKIALAIAANKCDLERQRAVPVEAADAYASSIGAAHFLTSAKVNRGVEKAFLDLSRRLVAQSKGAAAEARPGAAAGAGSGSLRIVDDDAGAAAARAKGSKCCS